MTVTVEAGLRAMISTDGELTLVAPCGTRSPSYAPEATAVWIALRQHGGDSDAATRALTDFWVMDVSEISRLVDACVTRWHDDGLVTLCQMD